MKLVSTDYTIYINDNDVIMSCNRTHFIHSLNRLCITTNDILFFLATQHLGNEAREARLKNVILSGNVNILNRITGQDFIAV